VVVTKPPYRVPSMEEIRAIPWNGFRVASTFSGAGGSCLGYRMAGFKVVWSSEFVPEAQTTYRANAEHETILDCRDVRQVQASEILDATGLKLGELDLFDGSPPCQAFSTAGKRHKGWGTEKRYEHGAKQRNEDLFFEYCRLLRGLQPKCFVAENVSGLVKGAAKGYFLNILSELKSCGYRVACRVLDAQWLGVPQARQRTIFVGVRKDLGREPVHPKPLLHRFTVRDAIEDIVRARYDTRGDFAVQEFTDKACPTIMATPADASHYKIIVANEVGFKPHAVPGSGPCPTILASGACGSSGFAKEQGQLRKFTIAELRRICGFPDDFVLTGSYAQQWERLGNAVPPVMMAHIAATVRDRILKPWQDEARGDAQS